jgi:hypothetical protein
MSVTTFFQTSGTDLGTKFCDLTNTQTIAGVKTFSSLLKVPIDSSSNFTPVASQNWVNNQGFAAASSIPVVTGYAPLASPTFTGTPSGPTAATGTNTTQFASTAFVQSAIPTIPAIPAVYNMCQKSYFWKKTGWTKGSYIGFDVSTTSWGMYMVVVHGFDSAGNIVSDGNGMCTFFVALCYDSHGRSTTNRLLTPGDNSYGAGCPDPATSSSNSSGTINIGNGSDYSTANVYIYFLG